MKNKQKAENISREEVIFILGLILIVAWFFAFLHFEEKWIRRIVLGIGVFVVTVLFFMGGMNTTFLLFGIGFGMFIPFLPSKRMTYKRHMEEVKEIGVINYMLAGMIFMSMFFLLISVCEQVVI